MVMVWVSIWVMLVTLSLCENKGLSVCVTIWHNAQSDVASVC